MDVHSEGWGQSHLVSLNFCLLVLEKMLLKTGNLLQCSGAELYFASLIFIIITLSAAIGRESLQVETV